MLMLNCYEVIIIAEKGFLQIVTVAALCRSCYIRTHRILKECCLIFTVKLHTEYNLFFVLKIPSHSEK